MYKQYSQYYLCVNICCKLIYSLLICLNKETNMNINKSLDHYMGLNGFSQADVCKESDLSPASISLIRNGHRSPSLKTMVILAELFQVKLSEFIAAGE